MAIPFAVVRFRHFPTWMSWYSIMVYGLCGSRYYRWFGLRATAVENGNAGPKLHWLVWEESVFSALPCDGDLTVKNDTPIWFLGASTQLFLAYCLYFRVILKKWQRKDGFAPIGSSAEEGPALPISICRENGHAMRKWTQISRPAWSVRPYWSPGTAQATFPNGPQSDPTGAQPGPNCAQPGPNRGPTGAQPGPTWNVAWA